VTGDEAFRLHDTFGFPIDLTEEIASERGVPLDRAGFDAAMAGQRARSSAAAVGGGRVGATQELVRELDSGATEFTGYVSMSEHATVTGGGEFDGRTVVKLDRSPFYAQGGGQVSDSGALNINGAGSVDVLEVLRAGDDQALVVDGPAPPTGTPVQAEVDRAARIATQANHTATHLLHAALRETLGTHVRQAGSYVGPDKLRFDFTHGQRLSPEELKAVEDRVNQWILSADPVRPITTTLDEAKALGAMALFGEKYGDIVRMVQIGDGDYSIELCGGTHVRSTAEIGVFKITSEGSSASNVRRIEAVTGTQAVALLRSHDALLRDAADVLRVPPPEVPAKVAALREAAATAAAGAAKAQAAAVDIDDLASQAAEISGVPVLAVAVEGIGAKQLPELADRLKDRLGEGVAVIGSVADGRVSLAVAVAPQVVDRGVRAGEIVRLAAPVIGGGGGGRDTMAQAGGKNPEKLADALQSARAAIVDVLTGG
jgi:alanyl-tRNA synthetase